MRAGVGLAALPLYYPPAHGSGSWATIKVWRVCFKGLHFNGFSLYVLRIISARSCGIQHRRHKPLHHNPKPLPNSIPTAPAGLQTAAQYVASQGTSRSFLVLKGGMIMWPPPPPPPLPRTCPTRPQVGELLGRRRLPRHADVLGKVHPSPRV
jgi:hypothetical protein